MTSEAPLYERDPEAWRAYLAEGNAKQARKRVSADVILRDGRGRILLVDPRYKPDWDLPGGMAEANEPPADAVRRELCEELGLEVRVGSLLCVDWVSPHDPWDDLINFIGCSSFGVRWPVRRRVCTGPAWCRGRGARARGPGGSVSTARSHRC